MTVEPVLELFEFGSPPFERLVSEFRTRVIVESRGGTVRYVELYAPQ